MTYKVTNIRLSDLPPDEALEGDAPSKEFIESIKHRLLQPIVVKRTANGLEIAAGRRRIRAARKLNWESIPAFVIDEDGDPTPLISLIENHQRSENPISDLHALQALFNGGMDEDQIVAVTGIPKVTIRRIMRISALIPELYAAALAGRIKTNIAVHAARLPERLQRMLIPMMDADKHKRLKMHHVEEIRRTHQQKAMASLANDLFDGADEDLEEDDWRSKVRALLEQAYAEVPEGEDPMLRKTLEQVLQVA